MRLLLDTHALAWYVEGGARLGQTAREAIGDADNDVLVYVGGEMGRTPKIGQSTGNGAGTDGRDHWPRAGFGLFAGGGLKMGQVVGRTDRIGGAPIGTPYVPQNMLATLYHVLGIDPVSTLPDYTGRPVPLLDDSRPIGELV